MENTGEHILIGKIISGDTGAYRDIVDIYGKQVFSLISGIVRNREDAEELTSDTFLKVYANLHKFKGDSKFSTWLYRIAYNTAVSHTRRRKINETHIDEERIPEIIEDETEETVLREASLEKLEQALLKLSGKDAALIEMFYRERMHIEEISEITGESPGNVKVKLYRIRKKLSVILNNGNHG